MDETPTPADIWPFEREIPTSESYRALPGLRAEVDSAREADDRKALARSLGRLGDHYRAQRHPEAVEVLEEALQHSMEPRAQLVNGLRLATARFYAGDHGRAEESLRALAELTDGSGLPGMEDYVLQHLGKCLAEQGEHAEAAVLFGEALQMRAGVDDRASEEASSRRAVRAIQTRMATKPDSPPAPNPRARAAQGRRWLQCWHDEHAGATRRGFASMCDAQGRSTYERLAASCGAGARVLDLACGDGPLLERLEARGEASLLVGLDMSEGELQRAHERLDEALLVQGLVHQLPFVAGSFDVVLCHMALMLFADLGDVLEEIYTVLRPGGRLVAVLGGSQREEALNAWEVLVEHLWEFPLEGPSPILGAEAFDPQVLRELAEAAGFRQLEEQCFTVGRAATPADVWEFFEESYDPARLRARHYDQLLEAFFGGVHDLLDERGEVPFSVGMRMMSAVKPASGCA